MKSRVFSLNSGLCVLSGDLCCELAVSQIKHLALRLASQKVRSFLRAWLTASLSESQTPSEGGHAGESHFSPEPAARGETGAHRCSSRSIFTFLKGQFRTLMFQATREAASLLFVTQRTQSWWTSTSSCLTNSCWSPRSREARRCVAWKWTESLCSVVRRRLTTVCCCPCAEGSRPGAEPTQAAAEPGAGSAAEGGKHLHRGGPARLTGSTPAQEHWPAQCFKWDSGFCRKMTFWCGDNLKLVLSVSLHCHSFRTSSFIHNYAPEPLPAVRRSFYPASCFRVFQGVFTSTTNMVFHCFMGVFLIKLHPFIHYS